MLQRATRVRRIWILVGKPNERKEVCKEEWEGLDTKVVRHGAALGRHTRAAAVQGSNLAITVRAVTSRA
jgi:hypothetical protein